MWRADRSPGVCSLVEVITIRQITISFFSPTMSELKDERSANVLPCGGAASARPLTPGQLPFSVTSWRNGSASDSRSEGCVFKSRRGQVGFFSSQSTGAAEGVESSSILRDLTSRRCITIPA